MTEQTSRPAPYKISGLVHEVHPVRTFASGFKLQEVVVVDDPGAKYPHYVVVEFAKDRTDFLMGVEKGMAVDADTFTSSPCSAVMMRGQASVPECSDVIFNGSVRL